VVQTAAKQGPGNGLLYKNVSALLPQSGSTLTNIGWATTVLGTISHPALSAGTFKTRGKRWLNTSAATAGALAYHRASALEFSRDIGATVVMVGGISTLVAGQRWFMGLADSTAVPTNVDPLATTTRGLIGLAFNTNSGNLKLINNVSGAGAPTALDLGAGFTVNTSDVWELRLSCEPAATEWYYKIHNLSSGAIASGTLTVNIPPAAALLGKLVWTTNNATAAACAMDFMRLGSESNN
jgi:hypothetical protein